MNNKLLSYKSLLLSSAAGVVNSHLRTLKRQGLLKEGDFWRYYLVNEIILRVVKKQCKLAPESITKVDLEIDFNTQQIRFVFYDKEGQRHQGLFCIEKRTSSPVYFVPLAISNLL
ncbi:MAG: hypothetical protein PHW50_00475 [Patescibacteria group bacterium]|nr:hypothetical protein [Patescibacteria group bacterium]